jgi:hypothetical protein
MFVWLVENAGVFYWLLGLTALGLAAAWWSTRQRNLLIALGAVIGALGLVWLLSLIVDTDQKRLQRITDEMVQGVRERKLDKVFAHVSSSFTWRSMNTQQFRDFAQQKLRQHSLDDLSISTVQLLKRRNGQATIEFWVHTAEAQGAPVRCEIDFVQENGVWKMKGFDLYMANTGNKWLP